MPEIIPDIVIYGGITLLVGYIVGIVNMLFFGAAAVADSERGVVSAMIIHALAVIAAAAGWTMVIVGTLVLLLRLV